METNTSIVHSSVIKFINVGNTEFAYKSIGKQSSVPLVCMIHFSGNMDDWDPLVIAKLSETRQVILFDNRGIGKSGGTTPYTIKEMADDTVAFINALGLTKVDLLGYSLGGFIAQVILYEHPELVRKAILAGTSQQGGDGITTFGNFIQQQFSKQGIEIYLGIFFEDSDTSRSEGYKVYTRIHTETESGNRDIPNRPQVYEAQTKAIENWLPENNISILKNIPHPVLIVNGSNDHMFSSKNSVTMFEQLPNAQLSLYPDSAHAALFQHAELFAEQSNYFLTNDF